jgi:hypothetical protein
MHWMEKVGQLDRRVIFVMIALAVIVPLIMGLVFPVYPSTIVTDAFDQIEALPPGGRVLLSLDYGPATAPENQPMASAISRHALARDCKLYVMALWATGPGQANILIEDVLRGEFPDKVEGIDWVHLGFKAGNQGLINAILLDMKGMYTTDSEGRAIDDIPMMDDIRNLTDFDVIMGIGSGFPGMKEWVQFAGDRGNIPIAGGVTAVEAPAEYEAALVQSYPRFRETGETAVRLMGPQAVAHTVIILFVLIGNVAFVFERRRTRQG